mgnify:CR=1 FL=1
MKHLYATFLFVLVAIPQLMAQKNLLYKLLHHNAGLFGDVLREPGKYNVQVIYTQIDRDGNNFPRLTSHTWRLDEKQYYYPASTVKMPIAILALEKINHLKIKGLDRNTPLFNLAGSPPQTAAVTDTTSATGLPSVAHYAKKIFLVSDNDASNRLYEFLGQAQLNEALWAKGFNNVKITHRLGITGFDEMANRHTNPVRFAEGETLYYHQGEVYGQALLDFRLKGTQLGKGYYEDGQLVNAPFDFSKKNYISLQVQHDILLSVIFPEAVPAHRRFDLTAEDYRFLYQVMSELPGESRRPDYSGKPDHYVKFFLFGDRKEDEKMPANVRVFNKVGWAYGFLTDVAYIVDFDAGTEFFLAATIQVNENGIFNDDKYEYETVGLPFLANLGRVVYEHDRQRKRKNRPDLSKFKIDNYD